MSSETDPLPKPELLDPMKFWLERLLDLPEYGKKFGRMVGVEKRQLVKLRELRLVSNQVHGWWKLTPAGRELASKLRDERRVYR